MSSCVCRANNGFSVKAAWRGYSSAPARYPWWQAATAVRHGVDRDVALRAYLTDRPGCPVSREELLREVWGYRCVSRVETRCVDMHVSKLRRRLALLTDDELVQTVRGAGYRAGGPG